MKNYIKSITYILIFTLFFNITTFAGEFKILNDMLYFNNGTKSESTGLTWIMNATESIAYCYYLNQGFLLINQTSPDGYVLDEEGHLIVDKVVATKSELEDNMFKETNWDEFRGSYRITKLLKNDEVIQEFGQFEWPVKVSEDDKGYFISWNGRYIGSDVFYKNDALYSLESRKGNLVDVIDENNFRLIFKNGEIAIVEKTYLSNN